MHISDFPNQLHIKGKQPRCHTFDHLVAILAVGGTPVDEVGYDYPTNIAEVLLASDPGIDLGTQDRYLDQAPAILVG